MSMLSQVFGSVCVAGVLLLNAVGADAASSTPFDDAFDYADGTSLDGTNGWAVTGNGSATTTNGQARLMDATLVNAFGGGTRPSRSLLIYSRNSCRAALRAPFPPTPALCSM